MSTHCSIAVVNDDGTVEAVYCHFDGNVRSVGRALVLKFNSKEAAQSLVALGDLSSVAGRLEAFSRDLGEPFEDNKPRTYGNLETYGMLVTEEIVDSGYRYFFRDGQWYVWGEREGLLNEVAGAKNLESLLKEVVK